MALQPLQQVHQLVQRRCIKTALHLDPAAATQHHRQSADRLALPRCSTARQFHSHQMAVSCCPLFPFSLLLQMAIQCAQRQPSAPAELSSLDAAVYKLGDQLFDLRSWTTLPGLFSIHAITSAQTKLPEQVRCSNAYDVTGHYGVGVLLESCLADKLAFVERTRRMIRKVVEAKVAKKIAERVAAY